MPKATPDKEPVHVLLEKDLLKRLDDFRFKQRVWFLKETKSVCPNCATGCNTVVASREGVDPLHHRHHDLGQGPVARFLSSLAQALDARFVGAATRATFGPRVLHRMKSAAHA